MSKEYAVYYQSLGSNNEQRWYRFGRLFFELEEARKLAEELFDGVYGHVAYMIKHCEE